MHAWSWQITYNWGPRGGYVAGEVGKVETQEEIREWLSLYTDLLLQWRSGLLVMKSNPSDPVLALTVPQLDVGVNRYFIWLIVGKYKSSEILYLDVGVNR